MGIRPLGVAVAIYPDNQQGTLDWARWDQTNGWLVQTDVAFLTKGFTESVQIETTPEGDRLLVVVSDHNLRLFASTYDGTSWQLSNLGAPLTTTVSSAVTVPFSLAVRSR